VDSTGAGIRDDIKVLVTQIGTPEQQPALRQVAKAIQLSLVKNETQADAVAATNALDSALACLAQKSPTYVNQSNTILSATVDTELRFNALRKFEKALVGADVSEIASPTCDS
jgi:hypothetical protein